VGEKLAFWGSLKYDKKIHLMDGEEGTTKYAKGAKREAKLLFKDESFQQAFSRVSRIS
jgi:hypothetical protein